MTPLHPDELRELELDDLARLVEAERAAPVSPSPEEAEAVWEAVRPRPLRRGLLAFAVALAAAVLVWVWPASDPGWDGVKGEASAPMVALEVVAGHFEAQRFVLDGRVADGDAVAVDATLIFELDVDAEAARHLLVVDGAGSATVLVAGEALEAAGPRRLVRDGDWVALALDDLAGPLTLLAAATREPADPQEAVLEPWRRGELPAEVGLQVLALELE